MQLNMNIDELEQNEQRHWKSRDGIVSLVTGNREKSAQTRRHCAPPSGICRFVDTLALHDQIS